MGQLRQSFVAGLGDGALPLVVLGHPGIGQSVGNPRTEFVGNEFFGPDLGLHQRAFDVCLGGQVQMEGLSLVPIAGNLQNSRTRQTPVREKQVFVKPHAGFFCASLNADGQGQARQTCIRCPLFVVKGERDQAWPSCDQTQAKLLGDAVAKIGGANFGNGQTASGNHHGAGFNRPLIGLELIAILCLRDGFNAATLPTQDAAFVAFFQKHLNQVFGGSIAKQLPFVLFVKRNVIRLHQVNEVLGGVTRQCTAAKVRVLA